MSTRTSSVNSYRGSLDKVELDHFEIIKSLEHGSFGQVYLVNYKPLSKYYAMKVLNKVRYMKHNMLRYAKTEHDILCYAKHPFIVHLDFAFQTSKKLFLILKYCPG